MLPIVSSRKINGAHSGVCKYEQIYFNIDFYIYFPKKEVKKRKKST